MSIIKATLDYLRKNFQIRKDTDYIVIHCTAGPSNQSIEAIKNYWKNTLGWKGVGYHVIIKANGEAVYLAPPTAIVNGVKGYNSRAYHICYIGGNTGDTRTDAQKKTIIEEVKKARELYPHAEIVKHRDLSPDLDGDGVIEPFEWVKLCPQFNATEEYAHL